MQFLPPPPQQYALGMEPDPLAGGGRLLGPDGNPITGDKGFLLPHHRTFAAILNSINRTYSYRYDEALKTAPDNALAMRRDCYVMSLLQERALPVANLEWSVVPEDPKSSRQLALAEQMEQILRRTRRLTMLRRNLSESANWYGRAGIQVLRRPEVVSGQMRLITHDWRPINGDKIQFAWDGTPTIALQYGQVERYGDAAIITGERNPMLLLARRDWRERFIIARSELEDADYFEGERAGAVQGVGVRHRIYWCWWLRDEALSWTLNYLQRAGMGLLIFWYSEGDKGAQAAAEDAARRSSSEYAFAAPRPAGGKFGTATAGVDQIPASVVGVDALIQIVSDYFERHIERYIVGQTLSAGTEGSGLGGSGVAKMHADTKFNIIRYDAEVLDDALTFDWLRPLQARNFRDDPTPLFFKTSVPDPDQKDKLDACKVFIDMGGAAVEDEIRDIVGLAKPGPADKTLGGQQPGQGPGGGGGPPGSPGAGPVPGWAAPGGGGGDPNGLHRPDLIPKEPAGDPNGLHRPDLATAYGKQTGWITLGAKDGKGGSPVYIEKGRITKGHPSLTGKKIDALKEDGDDGSHRQQVSRGKGYDRAVAAKAARKEGIDPADLHHLAGEIKAHDAAFVADRVRLLQSARKNSKALGYGDLGAIKARNARGKIDADSIRGLDDVAAIVVGENPEYSGLLGDDPEQALFDLLIQGNPEPMSDEEVYDTALGQLRDMRDRGEYEPAAKPKKGRREAEEPIPFAAEFDEAKHPRADDGKFGAGAGTPAKAKAKAPAKPKAAPKEKPPPKPKAVKAVKPVKPPGPTKEEKAAAALAAKQAKAQAAAAAKAAKALAAKQAKEAKAAEALAAKLSKAKTAAAHKEAGAALKAGLAGYEKTLKAKAAEHKKLSAAFKKADKALGSAQAKADAAAKKAAGPKATAAQKNAAATAKTALKAAAQVHKAAQLAAGEAEDEKSNAFAVRRVGEAALNAHPPKPGFTGTVKGKPGYPAREFENGKPVGATAANLIEALNNLTAHVTQSAGAKAAKIGAGGGPANAVLPDQTRPKFSAAEALALKRYSGKHAYELNRAIRAGGKLKPEVAASAKAMDAAFKRTPPLAAPVTVYRGLKLGTAQADQILADIAAAKESGGPIKMGGYISTTTDHETTVGFGGGGMTFAIKARHGIDLKPHSERPDEHEMLLPRDGHYKVSRAEEVNGRWQIEMEQLIDGGKP